jgi:hypothetical protein
MTSFQYYHSLIAKDDDETWDLLDERMYSEDKLDDAVFDNWE